MPANPVKVFVTLLLLMQQYAVYSQSNTGLAEQECKGYGVHGLHTANKATIASAREDDYDIHHLFFDLQVTDTSAAIAGSVTTSATVTAVSMGVYIFELADTLIVDSVLVNGQKLPCVTTGNVRSVNLPSPLARGNSFAARVAYHGFPPPSGVHAPGFHNEPNEKITFTLAEPYFAHHWWPCKQSLRDKIDSMDMWLTVPGGVKAGSNGLLTAITPIGTSHERYEWKTNYPIDYYLISIAACRYEEYSYYQHFEGSSDSMLMMNYVSSESGKNVAALKPLLDSTSLILNYFSGLFGRYPFWKEKYGHCYVPSFIAMEHQTMTSTRFSGLPVIIHELAHQWFGDQVTCGTWKDIWLNEGFATYAQYLGFDHFRDHATAVSLMRSVHSNVITDVQGSVYVDDTANWYRILDGRLTYNKAASVIHMLRFVVNDDEKFYGMLRSYLSAHSWGTATTEDFINSAENFTGLQLDTFFSQWIYGEGYPTLSATWNQENNSLFLRLDQTSSYPSSVASFATPVEVKFYSVQGDTTVRLYLNRTAQGYSFNCNKRIDSIAIDPNNWLLFKESKRPERDPKLDLPVSDVFVYPNPAKNMLYVEYGEIPDPVLILYDIAGKKAIEHHLQPDKAVDISSLPKGVYLYRVVSEGKTKGEGKVVKE